MKNQREQVLSEESTRTRGIDAQQSNIEAAKAVADIVKTTLGPMGMDKMLIDTFGNIVITNDGVKILKEMDIEHPGAKLLVEVAKTQENEVGDGTTSAVILAGEFLSKAQELTKQKIHPTLIARGYNLACEKALEILRAQGKSIQLTDKKVLKEICQTAMTGKVTDHEKDILANILFELTTFVKDETGLSKDKIKIVKSLGGSIAQSSLVKGIVLDKEPAHPNMPKEILSANIALVDFPLEVKELASDAKVQLNSLEQYQEFMAHEEEFLKSIVATIKKIGANVIVCQKGIDDAVSYYFAREKIIAVRRTKKSDLEKLSFALGCPIISSYDDLIPENLGKAQKVIVSHVNNEEQISIEGCKNPKAMTLILKASTQHVLDELERAVEDAIGDLSSLIKSKKIVGGAGAVECELYKDLIKYSLTLSGKEQMIVKAYAESFLCIPKVLCQNCGFDEIETMAKLISLHEKGKTNAGLEGYTGIVDDIIAYGIVEPINVKEQAIKSATESATMILRIDDIIAAKKIGNSNNSHSEEDM